MQPKGYRAFMPAPLPPDPPIEISGELQSRLSQADLALGRLDGAVQILPDPDLFVLMYIRKEAVLSSQIEGTQSSLQDLLAAEAQIWRPDDPKDVGEVINYVHAMNYGLEQLAELPVSASLVRSIHAQLLSGVRGSTLAPGELRTEQNWIGQPGSTPHEAVFVPPPPHAVANAMEHWERFLHEPGDLPVLIWIGLIHAQFETIHPFSDGNGRVGRLLVALLLCEQKVLQQPVLYISYYLKQWRSQYYEELQSVRDRGTWEQWLSFFLQGIAEVSKQAAETIRHILALRERHREAIAQNLSYAAGKGHIVLEYLYRHPIVSVRDIQNLVGVTYAAANRLVKQLETLGILQEWTGQTRNRRFIYWEYVTLFHEDAHSQME